MYYLYHYLMGTKKRMLSILTIVFFSLLSGVAKAQENPLGLKIHHATISVRNADSLSSWYVNTLGFKVLKTLANDERRLVMVGIPGFRIDLLQMKNSVRPTFQSVPAPKHILIQGIRHLVFEPGNFDQTYDYLVSKGVVFFGQKPESKPGANQTIYFMDPEGNILELIKEH